MKMRIAAPVVASTVALTALLGPTAVAAGATDQPSEPSAAAETPTSADEPEPTTNTQQTDQAEPNDESAAPDESDQTGELPDEPFISLAPAPVRAGQHVSIQVGWCRPTGTVHSPVLVPVELSSDPHGHQPWAWSARTSVHQDAEPGEYPVTVDCGTRTLSTTISVRGTGQDDERADQSSDDRAGQVNRVPRGAPETGGGPVGGPLAAVFTALGLTGFLGGTGLAAWRRSARTDPPREGRRAVPDAW